MIALKPPQWALDRYHRAGHWGNRSLGMMIADSVAGHPDKTVVRDASGVALSYGGLEDKAASLAGFMASRGVRKGDVVTMHLPNWWQTVVVTYAAFKIGAVINPLPPTYGWKDLAYVLDKTQARAIVMPGHFRSTDYTDHMARIHDGLGTKPIVIVIGEGAHAIGIPFEEAVSGAPLADPRYAEADGPAVLIFTSGSESRPKGVVHTHNTVSCGERMLAEKLRLTERDVCFMASPVSHTSGFMHGLIMTMNIASSVSLLDVFNENVALRQMVDSRASWTMGATPFLIDVVGSMVQTGRALPDLRYFLCGGAPIPESVVRQALDVGVRVLSVYGSTESPPHTVTWPEDPADAAWKADGRPLPGVEVRIVDASGVDVALGEQGEEWSRGPHAFIGYLDAPELTAAALTENGWYRSGDLARMTEDGSVRVVGRIKDMIIRGGQNISVREVEDALLQHPACRLVSIVGVAHPRLGEIGCAVVVCHPGQHLAFEEMKRFLIELGVARFKLPERLVVLDALPMTPSGKIQKYKLREQLKHILDS